jgi:hypothetical protein
VLKRVDAVSDSKAEEAVILSGARQLTRALWNKDYKTAFEVLNAELWVGSTLPFIQALKSHLKTRNLARIALAYSCLSLEETGLALGMSTSEAAESARTQGWTVEGDLVYPVALAQGQGEDPHEPDVAELNTLTSYISALEQPVLYSGPSSSDQLLETVQDPSTQVPQLG